MNQPQIAVGLVEKSEYLMDGMQANGLTHGLLNTKWVYKIHPILFIFGRIMY